MNGTQTATVDAATAIDRETARTAYRWMLLGRLSDEKFASLYRGGKIFGGVFIGRGQEALSVATAMALRPGDIFGPLIRDQAGRLAFGESLYDSMRTYLGSRLGPMRGRDGNVHRGKPKEGYYPMVSHLGSTVSAVAGMLMARRFKGESGSVGALSLGEGATSTGAFHEGINMAAVERLPLVVVVANNQYAYSTPTSRQFACRDLVDRAAGYGVDGHTVDGTRLIECMETLRGAVARARAGNGPQLVVARLLRLAGHGEHDAADYVDPALRASPTGQDCLKLAAGNLIESGWADEAELRRWHADAVRQIDDAVAAVSQEPLPDPNEEDWCPLASRHLLEVHITE
jgi:pyruvate dehydrogenase E1 component alpha subunit/2-oxoisovalerate dehydrogenase E1 component alpha subunit